MNGKELNENLSDFLSHLDSLKDTLPMVILLINPYQEKAIGKFQDFIKNNVEEIEDEDGKKSISIKDEQFEIFKQLSKNSQISQLAFKIIPESLFVSLISQYDAFLSRLLMILFNIRPEYINNSERQLTFFQLVDFDSIESAREYIIEKEIECVLRKSHSEQFDYLEKKITISLRENLPVWQTFIEITERRNLFVHCDGVVSNQYLKNCIDNKCLIDGVELNQRLTVEPLYFEKAYECLFELSVKLTHTIWRKLLIEDLKEADGRLNEICYELLNSRKFRLADVLLDFACKQKKHFNDSTKNVLIVNKALSQYMQNKKDNATDIINGKDWSASRDDFRLAYIILNDKYEEAFDLMRKIGNDGDVDKVAYKTWPLFLKIRKEEKFKQIFKEIFNEEYTIQEKPKRPVQELIEEFIEKNPELKDKTIRKELSDKEKRDKEK